MSMAVKIMVMTPIVYYVALEKEPKNEFGSTLLVPSVSGPAHESTMIPPKEPTKHSQRIIGTSSLRKHLVKIAVKKGDEYTSKVPTDNGSNTVPISIIVKVRVPTVERTHMAPLDSCGKSLSGCFPFIFNRMCETMWITKKRQKEKSMMEQPW